jgi:16S rRNA (guanine1516-N2)-methyltransferase
MLSLVVTTSRQANPLAEREASDWAARLDVPSAQRAGRSVPAVCRDEAADGVLVISSERPPTYVSADGRVRYFYHPGMALTRIKHLVAGKGDPMVTAMSLVPGDRVLDCTLGRAADAIVATFVVGPTGCVVGLESSPLLAALTIHGLRTYTPPNRNVEAAMRAIDARHAEHLAFLRACPDRAFEVVYFDPLFSEPVAASSAMQPLRPLADHRPLAQAAVAEARRVARRCVVIKERPRAPLWEKVGVKRLVGGKGSSVAYGVL